MFMMMIVIALAATIVEMMIVWRSPWLRETFKRWKLLAMAFSFALTILLSMVFGTSGTIVAGAAILSVLMSSIIYALRLLELLETIVRVTKSIGYTIRSSYLQLKSAINTTKEGYRKFRHPIASRKVTQ